MTTKDRLFKVASAGKAQRSALWRRKAPALAASGGALLALGLSALGGCGARDAGELFTGSSADAEDLTQETFCKAQASLSQLRDPAKVRGWLFSILRRDYLKRLRDDQREACVPLDMIGDVAEACWSMRKAHLRQSRSILSWRYSRRCVLRRPAASFAARR